MAGTGAARRQGAQAAGTQAVIVPAAATPAAAVPAVATGARLAGVLAVAIPAAAAVAPPSAVEVVAGTTATKTAAVGTGNAQAVARGAMHLPPAGPTVRAAAAGAAAIKGVRAARAIKAARAAAGTRAVRAAAPAIKVARAAAAGTRAARAAVAGAAAIRGVRAAVARAAAIKGVRAAAGIKVVRAAAAAADIKAGPAVDSKGGGVAPPRGRRAATGPTAANQAGVTATVDLVAASNGPTGHAQDHRRAPTAHCGAGSPEAPAAIEAPRMTSEVVPIGHGPAPVRTEGGRVWSIPEVVNLLVAAPGATTTIPTWVRGVQGARRRLQVWAGT